MNKKVERALNQIGNITVNDMKWQGQDNYIKLNTIESFKLIKQALSDKNYFELNRKTTEYALKLQYKLNAIEELINEDVDSWLYTGVLRKIEKIIKE